MLHFFFDSSPKVLRKNSERTLIEVQPNSNRLQLNSNWTSWPRYDSDMTPTWLRYETDMTPIRDQYEINMRSTTMWNSQKRIVYNLHLFAILELLANFLCFLIRFFCSFLIFSCKRTDYLQKSINIEQIKIVHFW